MKIYVVNEYIIEEDYHDTLGYFTELPLAQSVQPSNWIDLIIIKEMSMLDSQFVPTGFAYIKELESDGEHKFWTEWIQTFITPS